MNQEDLKDLEQMVSKVIEERFGTAIDKAIDKHFTILGKWFARGVGTVILFLLFHFYLKFKG